mgnify:CR=1 FL=1
MAQRLIMEEPGQLSFIRMRCFEKLRISQEKIFIPLDFLPTARYIKAVKFQRNRKTK